MKPKTIKELRNMGIVAALADKVLDFQKDNQIEDIEMIMMLQNLQCYLMDMIILERGKGE
jgi:hypothetical protein